MSQADNALIGAADGEADATATARTGTLTDNTTLTGADFLHLAYASAQQAAT